MKPYISTVYFLFVFVTAYTTPKNGSITYMQEIKFLQTQVMDNSAQYSGTTTEINDLNTHLKNDIKNTPKSTNSINGIVMIGDNYLASGDIYLLETKKGTVNIVDPQKINEGRFLFSDLSSDQYFFYVIPEFDYEFLYYPKYLPTYSGNAYLWENSSIQPVNTGVCIFSLINYNIPFYGENSIDGKVKYTFDFKGIQDIPIPVLLLDYNKIPMDFRIADKFTGEYSFKNIPSGKYYIHPEVPGIKTNDYEIILNDLDDTGTIDFLIDNDLIQPDIEDIAKPELSDNFINYTIDSKVSPPFICELFSVSGICVYKKLFYSGTIQIDISQYKAGIYLFKVRTFDNSYVKTDKVYINNHL
jgi:hypothetical protein